MTPNPPPFLVGGLKGLLLDLALQLLNTAGDWFQSNKPAVIQAVLDAVGLTNYGNNPPPAAPPSTGPQA